MQELLQLCQFSVHLPNRLYLIHIATSERVSTKVHRWHGVLGKLFVRHGSFQRIASAFLITAFLHLGTINRRNLLM